MNEVNEIVEIRERVRDLIDALRDAESSDLAQRVEDHALGFTHATEVRRSVNAIAMQLAYWRETGRELPESAPVQIAANRLEDLCRDALKSGVIAPALPSLRSHAKRSFSVASVALLCGLTALAVPVFLVASGVDITDIRLFEEVPEPIDLAQGEETSLEVRTFGAPSKPAEVTGVRFRPAGDCSNAPDKRGACNPVERRLWAVGRVPTFEQKLSNQAYGLLFAVDEERYASLVGRASLLLAATDNTPEGTYRIDLAARFLGPAPACHFVDELVGQCSKIPRTDAGEDAELVPPVLVRVVPGDPARRLGERERKQREAEEQRRRAEQRAGEIATVLKDIRAALKKTDALLKKRRYEPARQHVERLATLFEPLGALAAEQLVAASLPEGVAEVRERYDGQRAKIAHFEDDVFDAAFEMLNGPQSRRRSEDALVARLARRFRVSRAYVQEIYASRPDRIEEQLVRRAAEREAKQRSETEALKARCGPLPSGTWQLVRDYLKRRHSSGQSKLGECMTPRLAPDNCWSMICDYSQRFDDHGGVRRVTRLRAAFHMKLGRVTGHGHP